MFLGFVPGSARRLAISAHLDALLDPAFLTRRVLSTQFEATQSSEISPKMACVTLAIWFLVFTGGLLLMGRRHDFVDAADMAR